MQSLRHPSIYVVWTFSRDSSLIIISNAASFQFTSQFCYRELLKGTVTKPVVPIQWSVSGGPGFNSDHLCPLLREPFCENSTTDIAWLIALRGIKVCDSLHRWGYISSASWAVLDRRRLIIVFRSPTCRTFISRLPPYLVLLPSPITKETQNTSWSFSYVCFKIICPR